MLGISNIKNIVINLITNVDFRAAAKGKIVRK